MRIIKTSLGTLFVYHTPEGNRGQRRKLQAQISKCGAGVDYHMTCGAAVDLDTITVEMAEKSLACLLKGMGE